jgi:hypothetical protein
MGLDTAEIGGDKHIGGDRRVFGRYACAPEGLRGEGAQVFGIDDYGSAHSVPYYSPGSACAATNMPCRDGRVDDICDGNCHMLLL